MGNLPAYSAKTNWLGVKIYGLLNIYLQYKYIRKHILAFSLQYTCDYLLIGVMKYIIVPHMNRKACWNK